MSSGPAPGGSDHFPGFDVVGRAPLWDPVTAGVVLATTRSATRNCSSSLRRRKGSPVRCSTGSSAKTMTRGSGCSS